MSRYDDEDGDTVLDDRLSDYDGDEERPHLTSGEAAAIREVEKHSRKIQTLFLVVTFFGSLLISTVKWYSRPRGAGPVYDGLWDIFGTGYTDKQNQMRLNRTLAYLLAANISGHDGWLPTGEEGTGTLLDLYDSAFSPQYQASVWISTVDHRRLNIPDAEAVSSINEYLFVQRYVLAVLFFATGGLKNWAYSLMFLSGSHECDWFDLFEVKGMPLGMGLTFGIGCDKDPQTYVGEDWQKERIVTHIVMLPGNGMEGTLPMELHHLKYLKELHIDVNPGIIGTIPSEYGQFTHMQKLALSFNSIEGKIPNSFSSLTSLEQLNLKMNYLQCNTTDGDLDFIKDLKKLSILSLEYNANISGTLPGFLSNLSQLRLIAFSNNNMSGKIPNSWSTMNNLQYLFLDDNNFSGSVEVLQNMTNLTNIYLQGNHFTGNIDDSFFSNLANLTQLDISNNTFHGTIPGHLFKFPKLEVLDMSFNHLTGELPADSMSLTKSNLQHLALISNNITGSIPQSIMIPSLTHLDLSLNLLSGSIPQALGDMTNLTYLFLARNNFTVNDIPLWLQNLTQLTELSLKGLNFTGHIPEWLGSELTELIFLDLGENSFNGQLPVTIGNLSKLWVLILNQNNLNGTIPESMSKLTDLEVLLVDDNKFKGNTSVMCNRLDKINHFVADCASDNTGEAEITCDCCTLCCNDENVTCNDYEWLGNHKSMWENGYTRWTWEFESGSVSPLNGDR